MKENPPIYTLPKLVSVSDEKMFFQFFNGSISKIFKQAKPYFNMEDTVAFYEITNIDGSIEYMDLLGNFLPKVTKLGMDFATYYSKKLIFSLYYNNLIDYHVDKITIQQTNFLQDVLVDYFWDKKFLDAVISIEYTRYKIFEDNHQFKNFLAKLYYKRQIKKIIDAKVKKAEIKKSLIKSGEYIYQDFYDSLYKGGLDY